MGVALTWFKGRCGSRGWLGLAAAAMLLALPAAPAVSQGTGIVGQSDAVVTGFSQATIISAPPGADPYDYYMINPNGPAARVVDLSTMGMPGTPTSTPKPFSVLASQVGQVFGAALDNATRPNIYLAATSAYGLEIVTPDANGNPHRIHTGTTGATYAPGQFGPAVFGGGPGSIWKVDGTTGAISLLATIQGAGPAALGGMAFDPTTQTLYVADRTSGKVYRLGTNGMLKGIFDHGVEARPSAGLPPIPAPAAPPVSIQSPTFNTENPNTWGLATPARRIFALAVHNNRLYYSLYQGPQIWSSAIGNGGSITGADARMEVELPSLDAGVEVTSIDFDAQGYMYVAERGATTGDYFLIRLANDGQSRVVRYRPKPPGDPSPGLWALTPDQYSIGMPPNYTNADGGVALHNGYRFDGTMDSSAGACDQTVWATGERLLDPGTGNVSFPFVDGIQGTPRSLVQPANTPPGQSWYTDYDDGPGYGDFRGHMGAIVTPPCVTPVSQPPPPPPVSQCPPGTYFDGLQCIIIPTCPQGTSYVNGQCIYPTCPPGFVLNNIGQCVPPPQACPPNTFYYQGQCVLLTCPPGMLLTPKGTCQCPAGEYFFNGKCVPPAQCPTGSIQLGNGICICPLGLIFGNGVCQPQQQGCPNNQELWNGYCVAKCPPNQIHVPPNGTCQFPPINCPPAQDYFNGLCVNKCPAGQEHTLPDGMCQPIPISCAPSQDLFNNVCVAKCSGNQIHSLPNGQCINPPNCPPTQELWNGLCLNKCPALQEHKFPNGACGPIFVPPVQPIQQLCLGFNKEIWDGKCVDKCPGNQVHTDPNGACKAPVLNPNPPVGPNQVLCLGVNKEIWENKCVDKCPANQIHKQPNGDCGPAAPGFPPLGPLQIGPLQISPAAQCAVLNQDLFKGNCIDKCQAGQIHKEPDGVCGAPPANPNLPLQPVQPPPQLSPAQQCALQNKDFINGACLDKCGPNQEHKPPNGACGPTNAGPLQVNPNLPLQVVPTQQSCNAQGKDLYNGMCVDKCGPNQEHKPPNGTCGPTNAGQQIIPGLPIQIAPSQQSCAAQNMDYYAPTMMCVAKCGPNQEHKPPNGTCGPTNAGQQIIPGLPIQIAPSQQSCAAQNMDYYAPTMMCVAKCGPNQEHKPPNGACGPTNAGQQIIPGLPIQIAPSQQSCAAQNMDYYAPTMMCVAKCGPNQEHKPPNGACGPTNAGPPQVNPNPPLQVVPTQQLCNAQGKDFYSGMCVDKCAPNQEHKAPGGACGPINAGPGPDRPPTQLQRNAAALCGFQGKDIFDNKCVDKCADNEIRNDDGMCVPKPPTTP